MGEGEGEAPRVRLGVALAEGSAGATPVAAVSRSSPAARVGSRGRAARPAAVAALRFCHCRAAAAAAPAVQLRVVKVGGISMGYRASLSHTSSTCCASRGKAPSPDTVVAESVPTTSPGVMPSTMPRLKLARGPKKRLEALGDS